MSGQKIGYIRVSSADQNTERQLDGMEFDRTFTDKASGKDLKRPQFEAMIKHVREGDVIYVHSLDRFARNLGDLLKTVEELNGRGVQLQFVKENMQFLPNQEVSNHLSKLTLSIMGAFAEFERALIRERQQEGINLAKQRGVYKGRKKALSSEQAAAICTRVAAGDKITKIAADLGVTRQTIYQYLKTSAV